MCTEIRVVIILIIMVISDESLFFTVELPTSKVQHVIILAV